MTKPGDSTQGIANEAKQAGVCGAAPISEETYANLGFPFGPIPHWIKCSDEPAPKTKKVLALDIDGDMAVVWHNTLGFVRGYSGDTLGGDYDYFEPIAWMPLPEPPND